VERVLRFSRTGRPDDDVRDRVDASSEVQRIVEEFCPLAAARGSNVAVHTEPVPPLALRPAALRHIVLNLLDNAVKYGPQGGVVHVRAFRDGERVRVEVEDHGPGIEPIHQARIFERFYRGDPARSRDVPGTGLGLALVKHLCDAMSAEVGFDTTPGAGSIFRLWLPAAAPAEGIAAEA
jgi:two-component system phosphate regulon sensor histidine kinase PhoR